MPIIGTLPNNIQNGNTVDATPVMADFNFIVNQVNANANPTGTLTAPSGTRTVFHQASAPVGWVTDATLTDHTIQIQATGGGGLVGVNGYSTMFNAAWTSDGHALTTAELAAHNHVDSGHFHGVVDPQHSHFTPGSVFFTGTTFALNSGTTGGQVVNNPTTSTSPTNISIANANANIQNTGSGNAHSHTKQFNVLCAQMIMAQKT